jgi:hypothetical protein
VVEEDNVEEEEEEEEESTWKFLAWLSFSLFATSLIPSLENLEKSVDMWVCV